VAELGVGVALVQVFFDLKIRGKNLICLVVFFLTLFEMISLMSMTA
jgi:hypothetical protein